MTDHLQSVQAGGIQPPLARNLRAVAALCADSGIIASLRGMRSVGGAKERRSCDRTRDQIIIVAPPRSPKLTPGQNRMAPIIGSHATQAASVQVAGRRELPAELAGLPKLIENRVSHIHGLGTFTTAPLQEGQIFWFLDDKKVLRVTKANHDLLLWAANLHPERYGPLCDAMHCYCYYEEPKNALMFILDGGRYLNHSESPTSVFRLVNGYQVTVAARDLPAGTEIVEDYFTYDRAPWCPAPLSEYLVPGLEKCAPSGERPAEGRHTLFELTPEQYAVLKESPLPDGLGRVFFDACVPDEKGGASVFVDI